jgi:hypothetical protein
MFYAFDLATWPTRVSLRLLLSAVLFSSVQSPFISYRVHDLIKSDLRRHLKSLFCQRCRGFKPSFPPSRFLSVRYHVECHLQFFLDLPKSTVH